MNSFLTVVVFIAFLFILSTAAWAGIIAAPWVPTRKKDVARGLNITELSKKDRIADLGCGDARILTEAAKKYRLEAHGYEISVLNFLWSWLNALITNFRLGGKFVHIHWKNFFQEDLSKNTVIFSYLTPNAMKKLSIQFRRQLAPGTRIVSFGFVLPGFTPKKIDRQKKQITIYLYQA